MPSLKTWTEGCPGRSGGQGGLQPRLVAVLVSEEPESWRRKDAFCALGSEGSPCPVGGCESLCPQYKRGFLLRNRRLACDLRPLESCRLMAFLEVTMSPEQIPRSHLNLALHLEAAGFYF